MRKFKIFYSWQSDLPANKTRSFIRECIDEAIEFAEESEAIESERDEATKGMTGSPNIVTTLFSKIDECDFFVADVSLCYTSNKTTGKRSPNPNVLLELGYAVKTLGWERVICLCNIDFGNEYPFDIAHNRITNFSLEGKNKNEVKSNISKILFFNIRTLRKSTPRHNTESAIHIIGTYDFDEHVIKEMLVPIDIKQQEAYCLHNAKLLEESKKIFYEIQELTQKMETHSEMDKSVTANVIENPVDLAKNDALSVLSNMFKPVETLAFWDEIQEDTKLIKDWLGMDVSEDFFSLGGLKRVTSSYNPLNDPPTLLGTDAEKEKYNKLHELSRCLMNLEVRTGYLKTFDGMIFVPIAIQNVSSLQDENIRVVIHVENGEIIEPNERLILDEYDGLQRILCRNDDDENDDGIICELFGLKEDGIIHLEDIPFAPPRYTHKMPIMTANGFGHPAKSEEDYALELQEFIALANGAGYYEFNVGNLRPRECKWLRGGILIKPFCEKVGITYHIHSKNSIGDLSGSLEILTI